MAFWGVSLSPYTEFCLQIDETRRLHISRATLGAEASRSSPSKKNFVQCCLVGKKRPISLCCLTCNQKESCSLHIEFAGSTEIVFSVEGTRFVHLAGYFEERGVTEKILDGEKPANENGLPTSQSKGKDESVDIQKKFDREVSKKRKKKAEDVDSDQVKKSDKEVSKKRKKTAEDAGNDQVMGTNREYQDGETERLSEDLANSSLLPSEVGQESADRPKKKKKKDKIKVKRTPKIRNYSETDIQREDKAHMEKTKTDGIMQEESVENGADEKQSTDTSVATAIDNVCKDTAEKKKKKKKSEMKP